MITYYLSIDDAYASVRAYTRRGPVPGGQQVCNIVSMREPFWLYLLACFIVLREKSFLTCVNSARKQCDDLEKYCHGQMYLALFEGDAVLLGKRRGQ